jgi:hypothetical protein
MNTIEALETALLLKEYLQAVQAEVHLIDLQVHPDTIIPL